MSTGKQGPAASRTVAGHDERLLLARVHGPPARSRRAGRPRSARPVRRGRLPGADRRPDSPRRARRLALPDRRHGRGAARVDGGGVPRAAVRDGPVRHPLRDEVVEARDLVRRRVDRRAARGRRAAGRLHDGLLVRRLYDEPRDRGPQRRQGLGRDRARGRAAAARARRAGAPARAAPLLLEEREVGGRAARHGPRRARLLGGERLSQSRRPLEGGAVLERLTPPVAPRAPGRWQIATVAAIKVETPRVKSYRLELPMWMPHVPGQHYDVRLTAPDGYVAQRSYSVASSPLDEGGVELTIDCLLDGEVSPYFHDVVVEGDRVEVRGPFASYFVWRGESPVLLLGGGSGVVPLMAMLRHRRRTMPELQMRLVYSVGSADDVIYSDELGDEALLTFTREPPAEWGGHTGRIDSALLAAADIRSGTAFICGSNGFVEAASALALDAGFDPRGIRTERFGPTG